MDPPGGHDAAARPHRPGRPAFGSERDLAAALERADAAYGERAGNRADWYAAYVVAEQTGAPLPA
jgi:hypothetical protein